MAAPRKKPANEKAAPAVPKASTARRKKVPQKQENNSRQGKTEGSKATQFKPGTSGNPGGKPKGLRDAISKSFLSDVLTVWHEANAEGNHTGLDALRTIAATRPGQFVNAVGNLIPKEIALDDETTEGFASVWAALAKASASKDE